MKSVRYEGADDRQILKALALDKGVLAAVAARWTPPGLFSSQWANLVGSWCVDYFGTYGEPPAAALVPMYQTWAQTQGDKDLAAMVGSFLVALDDNQPLPATQYVLDLAQRHFSRISLERLVEGVQSMTSRGQIDQALAAVDSYARPSIGGVDGIDLLRDAQAWEAAFTDQGKGLITYGGAVGKFWGDELGRDSFVSLMGPEKRGKTFWLMDIAHRGLLQGHRVAYIAVGDMSQAQLLRRWGTRLARRPRATGLVKVPTAITVPPGARIAQVDFEEVHFQGLTWEAALAACQPHIRDRDYPPLRLVAKPAGSTGVADLRAMVMAWEREGWVPDVICLDYADILAWPSGVRDEREAINRNWQDLRGLSQELHCLLVTATQSDADSYSEYVITRKNFSGDKRKLAHVTAMVGLNATVAEADMGVTRLNFVVRRDDKFSETYCCHVAGCKELGQVCVKSAWPTPGKPALNPPPAGDEQNTSGKSSQNIKIEVGF